VYAEHRIVLHVYQLIDRACLLTQQPYAAAHFSVDYRSLPVRRNVGADFEDYCGSNAVLSCFFLFSLPPWFFFQGSQPKAPERTVNFSAVQCSREWNCVRCIL